MKVKIYSILFLTVFTACLFACSSFGTVTRGYSDTRERIWEAMTVAIQKYYGSVKKIESDPPTIVSNLLIKDVQFGLDKTTYQAFASLMGFTRPYVVDVRVRVYPKGREGGEYTEDRNRAEEILDYINTYLKDRKYNTTLQDDYEPY